jgi:anti-sigma factor ChrR (cupin superfamily)
MFVRSAGIVAGVVAAVTIMASTRVDGQGQPGGAVQMPATAMKWEPFAPGVPVDVVPLWGDRTKPGQYGMFLRLRAGQEAGMHAHTTDYYGVNVQGTWIRVLDGSTARTELPTGSYVFQPGKQFHNDICKGPEDCILLIHQAAGPSDVILPPAGTAR